MKSRSISRSTRVHTNVRKQFLRLTREDEICGSNRRSSQGSQRTVLHETTDSSRSSRKQSWVFTRKSSPGSLRNNSRNKMSMALKRTRKLLDEINVMSPVEFRKIQCSHEVRSNPDDMNERMTKVTNFRIKTTWALIPS